MTKIDVSESEIDEYIHQQLSLDRENIREKLKQKKLSALAVEESNKSLEALEKERRKQHLKEQRRADHLHKYGVIEEWIFAAHGGTAYARTTQEPQRNRLFQTLDGHYSLTLNYETEFEKTISIYGFEHVLNVNSDDLILLNDKQHCLRVSSSLGMKLNNLLMHIRDNDYRNIIAI